MSAAILYLILQLFCTVAAKETHLTTKGKFAFVWQLFL